MATSVTSFSRSSYQADSYLANKNTSFFCQSSTPAARGPVASMIMLAVAGKLLVGSLHAEILGDGVAGHEC